LRAVWAAVSAETSSVSVSEKSIASANRPKCLFKIRAPLPPGDRIEAKHLDVGAQCDGGSTIRRTGSA
jgi:hypothetical protein